MAALARLDRVWPMLPPEEQARIVALLVQRVDYDGSKETVAIAVDPTGLRRLADERVAQTQEETA